MAAYIIVYQEKHHSSPRPPNPENFGPSRPHQRHPDPPNVYVARREGQMAVVAEGSWQGCPTLRKVTQLPPNVRPQIATESKK